MTDFGIYVHFPYCASMCGYCDFPSIVENHPPSLEYADRVRQEIDLRASDYSDHTLRSIYFGGGTPSLWEGEGLVSVIQKIKETFSKRDPRVTPELEITVEMNPDSVTEKWLECIMAAGVNRFGVGVQSLDEGTLSWLGRRHTKEQALDAVQTLSRLGAKNISADLIVGIPKQKIAHVCQDIEQLSEIEGVSHISLYELTVSDECRLGSVGKSPQSHDRMVNLLFQGRHHLEQQGFSQYEVSNFSRPHAQCRHNLDVWGGNPVFGVGASAHSLLWDGSENIYIENPEVETYMTQNMELHRLNHDVPDVPWAVLPNATFEKVPKTVAEYERLFLGFRTTRGVDRVQYHARFKEDVMQGWRSSLRFLESIDLVERYPNRIVPTPHGMLFADQIAVRLNHGKPNYIPDFRDDTR